MNIKQNADFPIGKNIRDIRISRGLGQQALLIEMQMRDVNISSQRLGRIERGIIEGIYMVELDAIREILDTSYDELLKKAERQN